MSSTADYLLDRRKLSRQVTTWRAIAFGVAALAVVGLGWRLTGAGVDGEHVARLRISGVITGDKDTLEALRDIDKSQARAVLLDIDSPGGGTTGSEEIYEAIRRVATNKPTVAIVGSLGASGAYIAAIATDRIFVRQTSLVGSIGVLAQYPNVSGLLDKLGVKYESIKSSPLKASPNGFEPTSEPARAAIAAVIEDSFAWFKALVRERRGMSEDELAKVDDGRVFTGRQSLPLKLADALGGEVEARDWLARSKGVPGTLPVRDYTPGAGFGGFRLTSLASALFGPVWGATLGTSVDGLVSIWQMTPGN